MSKKIYLSPSNQSGNMYAYGNTTEMEQCNRIADAAKTALERCGFTVKKAPKGQDMYKSISESNAWGADLHMPIHTNAANGKCGGTMCMVYSKASENMKFANPIYKAVQAVTPGKTEFGIREHPELAELANTNMIAVYTEVDFHDNPTIAKWIIENVKTVGEAFAKGVCQAFGVTYKVPNTTASTPAKTETKPVNTVSDKDKFLNTARSYIGKNGDYVCKTKLKLGAVYDWCAFSVTLIMRDCGFIGKYVKAIDGGAGNIPRYSDGKYGTWFKKGTKSPQAGDLFFLRYADYPRQDKYFCDHVGIVEAVSGNSITTLEGNVDGYGSNWAATSTFKRKTRYLTDGTVYAFYRPNWQGKSSTTPTTTTKNDTSNIDVTYQVHTVGGSWLPNVKNLEDYAGLENCPIDGIYANVSKGHIRYRVKLIGSKNYLPWVTDREDYAGILGKQIDCVQMELLGVDGYTAEYRVSTAKTTAYLEWVQGYNNVNEDGYAGLVGVAIDKLQVRIVKK